MDAMEHEFFPSSSQKSKNANYWVRDDDLFKIKIMERYRKVVGTATIPFHLHFIWLGSPLPKVYESVVIESWKEKHPHWQITIWKDDEETKTLLTGSRSEAAFNAATNFGMKSDILRYEILYRYGGVYVDTDYECIENIDDILCRKTSCFMGISNAKVLEINNGLIGAVAEHPLINELINTITRNHLTTPIATTTNSSATFKPLSRAGAESLPSIFSSFLSVEDNDAVTIALTKNNHKDYMHTIGSTGPGLLTRAVYDGLTTHTVSDAPSELMQSILILPYFAFTPVPNICTVDMTDVEARAMLKEQYVIHSLVDPLKRTNDRTSTHINSNDSTNESNTMCSNESASIEDIPFSKTYAIHWWQRSWQNTS